MTEARGPAELKANMRQGNQAQGAALEGEKEKIFLRQRSASGPEGDGIFHGLLVKGVPMVNVY
jgi:hypothetical protein